MLNAEADKWLSLFQIAIARKGDFVTPFPFVSSFHKARIPVLLPQHTTVQHTNQAAIGPCLVPLGRQGLVQPGPPTGRVDAEVRVDKQGFESWEPRQN
jgi:hypothetical protein